MAFLTALPGLIALPPLDRDESLFAQATVQMLETGDFVSIRYQDQARNKKPPAINWLQAASVTVLSSREAREIWAYRIPSLLGAMLAAAALAWGVARFSGAGAGLLAGALLGSTVLLSAEGGIAKTDAVLCGAVTLLMAAFARLYAEPLPGQPPPGWRTRLLFWSGMALAILDKGPIGPLAALLAGLVLATWDRGAPWLKRMGFAWGLILVVAVVAPWAVAITVKTDGQFWLGSIGGDLAPKLTHGDLGHGAPPGLHTLLAAALAFPASALLPAALARAWRERRTQAARFAIAWAAPLWIVFEAMPTKLPHYPLPAYGALAWLAADAALETSPKAARIVGAGIALLAGGAFATAAGLAQTRFGAPDTLVWAIVTGVLAVCAGVAAAGAAIADRSRLACLALAVVLAGAMHAALVAGLAPGLSPLWLTPRTAAALDAARLNPRDGLTPGPVTVVGFSAPSLAFLLGTDTEFGDEGDAAEAISEGRPVLVEAREAAAVRKELADDKLSARVVGGVSGYDYTRGRSDFMLIYRSAGGPTGPAAAGRTP